MKKSKNQKKIQRHRRKYDAGVCSEVECEMHGLKIAGELPGKEAMKEVFRFMKTSKPTEGNFDDCFDKALESALELTKQRRFYKGKRQTPKVIQTPKDVELVMKQCLDEIGVEGPDKDLVKDFFRKQLMS